MHESSITDILQKRLGDKIEDFLIPPPVFELMHGEVLTIDIDSKRIKTRFPVLVEYQNPYRTMQGGMVAAAVDNTLGPLSMLVAPPNVTRRLEMTPLPSTSNISPQKEYSWYAMGEGSPSALKCGTRRKDCWPGGKATIGSQIKMKGNIFV